MFKNGFFYIVFMTLVFGVIGCSSNSGHEDDLDISEIKEIEATGEFSEDEFFSDEDLSAVGEEQLVDDIPGLEDELEGEVVGVEEDLNIAENEPGLDLADDIDKVSEDDALAFDDLFSQDDAEVKSEPNTTPALEDDLGFDDNVDSKEVGAVQEDVAKVDESDALKGDAFVSPSESKLEDEDMDTDLLAADVSVDSDYSSQVGLSDGPASDFLKEEVSIDVSYAKSLNKGALKGLISVKKMKTVPYSINGVLVNAIYFVREGDSLKTIAHRIYGQGSGVDFKLVNPHLKEGGLKVGQKVYYNSPIRSQDRSRLLTYYEDSALPVQVYNAREGENIRVVSKALLGHGRSWMEVWATNQQIESKGNLKAPVRIRYWKGGVRQAPVLAKNNQPVVPPPIPKEPELEPVDQANLDFNKESIVEEEEEPLNIAALDEDPIIDEPVLEDGDGLDVNTVPTREKVGGQIAPRVAVPKAEERDIARNNGAFPAKKIGIAGSDNMRMGIIGVALLLILIAGFLVVRRRRALQASATMESFDFDGAENTVLEDVGGKTKTQIDL